MTGENPHPLANVATVLISAFWAGALAGVSFLATPVKFQAASLDLPVALEVGKVTFAAFSRCEWGLSLLLGISVLLAGRRPVATACAAAAILLVLVQALWLLPVLDARIDAVIAGSPLPPSWHHMLYATSEALKLLLLSATAFAAFYSPGWGSQRHSIVR